MALATKLLEGIDCGGPSFVESLCAPGAVSLPQDIAHRVLEEWCQYQVKQAYGGHLLAVLRNSLPSTAVTFEKRLLGLPEDLGGC